MGGKALPRDLMGRIERVLDVDVRPCLALHQGDVRIVGLEGRVLRVKLTGACSACPSADLTTESFIEGQLRAALPELTEVVLVNGVSDGLLEQARGLMAVPRR
jgi:Fe-S cluster biogenesis protein NfuA